MHRCGSADYTTRCNRYAGVHWTDHDAGTRPRSRTPVSEEAEAAARVVLGMTVAVGGLAALIGWGNDDPLAVIALPVLVL